MHTNSCNLPKTSVCIVYEVLSRSWLEAVKPSGEDVCKGMHAVICDPLYRSCVIALLPNFDHHRLSLQVMSHFVEFLSSLRDLGMPE